MSKKPALMSESNSPLRPKSVCRSKKCVSASPQTELTRDFYRVFEDRHRGPRGLIKRRLSVYLPLIRPSQTVPGRSKLCATAPYCLIGTSWSAMARRMRCWITTTRSSLGRRLINKSARSNQKPKRASSAPAIRRR